jgi:hypothetical protein
MSTYFEIYNTFLDEHSTAITFKRIQLSSSVSGCCEHGGVLNRALSYGLVSIFTFGLQAEIFIFLQFPF